MAESYQPLWKYSENREHMQAGTFSSSTCFISCSSTPRRKSLACYHCATGVTTYLSANILIAYTQVYTQITLQVGQREKILLIAFIRKLMACSKSWFIFIVTKTKSAKFSLSVKTNLSICKTAGWEFWTRTHQYLFYHNVIVWPLKDALEGRILKEKSQVLTAL